MSSKMAAYLILGALLALGAVQATPLKYEQTAIIEDLRSTAGNSRVVGGWPAVDQQIPYQVSLRMVSGVGGVSSCGGSIIHHNWVLTAAHCLANRFTFVVRFGLTNLTRPDFIIESRNKVIHPGYNEIQAGVQTHDIALLGLDHHIPYSDTIQPSRLQNSAQKDINYDGKQLVVSGYGLTDDAVNGGTTSEILRWVYLKGITNEECLSWYSGSQVIREQTICAASYNESSQSSCSGDSGGPLTIVDYDGKTTMVGVVSFGHISGCNSPFPAGFVRPGHYHDWYQDVTGLNFDWTPEDVEEEGDGEDGEDGEGDGEDSEGDGEDSEGDGEDSEGDGEDGDGEEEDEAARVIVVNM